MAITYKGHSYGGLQSFVQRGGQSLLLTSDTAAPRYAHPIDGGIIQALDSLPVKQVLIPIANNIASVQSANALSNGIVVSTKSFPELWKMVCHCARILGIPAPMTVAIGTSELNAYTSGTDEKAFVCVSSTLLRLFSYEEACFVVGHECGHIHCHHVMYHMLYGAMTGAAGALGPVGRLVSSTAGVTLSAWSRRSEISSDRAGLLCCGDVKIAERALIRLITGFADLESVDLEDYLHQSDYMENEMPGTTFGQLFASHPSIPRRIRALRLFAESELYYELSGKPRPGNQSLLSTEELNQRVSSLIQ